MERQGGRELRVVSPERRAECLEVCPAVIWECKAACRECPEEWECLVVWVCPEACRECPEEWECRVACLVVCRECQGAWVCPAVCPAGCPEEWECRVECLVVWVCPEG